MSNKNKTLIYVLTDNSGSMRSIKNDVIGGFNSFLEDQRQTGGKCSLSYAEFNHTYKEVYTNKNIHDVEDLTSREFVTQGSTALFDAWGTSISKLKETLSAIDEEQRPGNIIFVIITDGEENSSREFTRDQIFNMTSAATEEGWHFTFLAANQDAIATGQNLGIKKDAALTFGTNSSGVQNTYSSLSKSIIRKRQGVDQISYSHADRDSSLGK